MNKAKSLNCLDAIHSINIMNNESTNKKEKSKLTVKDITLIGMMVAVIEVCKVALQGVPNVELTTFWIIIFSIFLGKRIFFVIPVFIAIEAALYGFGTWWFMYLYAWPLLAIIAMCLRKQKSALTWSILSGLFGLCFGLLCSVPYIVIGTVDSILAGGLHMAFSWWVAGIPYDILHGISNFVIMLVLYRPMAHVMKHIRNLT